VRRIFHYTGTRFAAAECWQLPAGLQHWRRFADRQSHSTTSLRAKAPTAFSAS